MSHDDQSKSKETEGANHSGMSAFLCRTLNAEGSELGVLFWSAAYFFFLLSGYYLIRPIRDEMAGDTENLKWLFTGTLISMLLINPVFSLIVAKFPRHTFIPWVYRFFSLNILLFYFLFRFGDDSFDEKYGWAFFVWSAVYSLFVVSVFWGLMADLFTSEQAKRLFGFIAVGGSFGALCGSYVTGVFADFLSRYADTGLGQLDLLLLAIVLLELSCQCVRVLCRYARRSGDGDSNRKSILASTTKRITQGDQPVGGGIFSGMWLILKSPYLLGISVFMILYTSSSTYLYVAKISVGLEAFPDRTERIAFFASIDFYTSLLLIIVQIFFTSRILKGLGLGLSLSFLALVTMVGFGLMAMAFHRPELMNILWVITIFEVIRKTSNYALARPAREALYTVLSREKKYKSKSFIDTAVYRLGDQIGVWSNSLLVTRYSFTPIALALVMVPLAGIWIVVAVMLGAHQKRLAAGSDRPD